MSDSLAIYLHDHYAGSHFAIELLDSIRKQYAAEPLGDFARRISEEIEQDRHVLRHLIETVGKTHLDTAEILGWLSEKTSELKLRRDHSGGLGTFEALEMLGLGIQGKIGLWTALPEIRASRTSTSRPSSPARKRSTTRSKNSACASRQPRSPRNNPDVSTPPAALPPDRLSSRAAPGDNSPQTRPT